MYGPQFTICTLFFPEAKSGVIGLGIGLQDVFRSLETIFACVKWGLRDTQGRWVCSLWYPDQSLKIMVYCVLFGSKVKFWGCICCLY